MLKSLLIVGTGSFIGGAMRLLYPLNLNSLEQTKREFIAELSKCYF